VDAFRLLMLSELKISPDRFPIAIDSIEDGCGG
jgi:hypothetical protein